MAFSEAERTHFSSLMDHYVNATRPDFEHRNKVDHHWKFSQQSIEVYSSHTNIDGRRFETSIAKARYVRSEDRWHIYWMRSDEKWHIYHPDRVVETLNDFLKLLDCDQYHLFWG